MVSSHPKAAGRGGTRRPSSACRRGSRPRKVSPRHRPIERQETALAVGRVRFSEPEERASSPTAREVETQRDRRPPLSARNAPAVARPKTRWALRSLASVLASYSHIGLYSLASGITT